MENEIEQYFKPHPKIRYCMECQHGKSKHEYSKKTKKYVCRICGCAVKKTSFV